MEIKGILISASRSSLGFEGHSSWVSVPVQGSVNVALADMVPRELSSSSVAAEGRRQTVGGG